MLVASYLVYQFGWSLRNSAKLLMVAPLCSNFSSLFPSRYNLKYRGNYCLMMSKFYQWVWCLLLVHYALAKFPWYLWLYLEGKRLEKLLHKGATIDNLAKFLTDHPNWYTRYEATSFFICQVLALMTSIVQIFLMNHYLGNSSFLDLFPMEQLGVRNSWNELWFVSQMKNIESQLLGERYLDMST